MTGRRVNHLLEEAAAAHGDLAAVEDGDRRSSYAELDQLANQVAHALIDRGVAPGDRVGLYLDKSIEAVAAIYGALKAGAAYVPLDPRGLASRLGYVAKDCELRCVVSAYNKARRWAGLIEEGAPLDHILVLEPAPRDLPADVPANVRLCGADEIAAFPSTPPPLAGAGELAYILYTSGSTGVPKGVMLTHDNALAFVDWAARAVGVDMGDRLSSHAPFHFDLSIFDLYVAAKTACPVVLVPRRAAMFPIELARFIEATRITVWYSVPSALNMLVESGGLEAVDLRELRTVIFAGEVFSTPHLARLMNLLPAAEFWNFFGPTETNVCTAYRVPEPPDPDGPDVPIGKPIDGVRAVVVTDDGVAVEPGGIGELLIGGPTVMKGYWADAEKTSQRLVIDPVGGSQTVYRTGDMVAESPDGNLRFFGRRDNQIKSRGYRIELGEIETALNGHPSIVECAAVAIPDPMITNRIHVYAAVRDDTPVVDLVAFCGDRLPAHMVPERIEIVERLPRSSTGKIDRQRLKAQVDSER